MTQSELIAIAKKYAFSFAQDDEERATVNLLTDIDLKSAALITFQSNDSKAKIRVYLEQDTGKFIEGGFTLGHH